MRRYIGETRQTRWTTCIAHWKKQWKANIHEFAVKPTQYSGPDHILAFRHASGLNTPETPTSNILT